MLLCFTHLNFYLYEPKCENVGISKRTNVTKLMSFLYHSDCFSDILRTRIYFLFCCKNSKKKNIFYTTYFLNCFKTENAISVQIKWVCGLSARLFTKKKKYYFPQIYGIERRIFAQKCR